LRGDDAGFGGGICCFWDEAKWLLSIRGGDVEELSTFLSSSGCFCEDG
jgi:hypothetical protein